MLDKNGMRQLVYVVEVAEIRGLPGYDRVESARVNGWWCIVPKNQFKPGYLGIYFEIDSKLPESNPTFAFMQKRKYHVKTQKMCGSVSQGLLMAPEDFGWCRGRDENSRPIIIASDLNKMYKEGDFLTADLGVTHWDAQFEPRKRTYSQKDLVNRMVSLYPRFFKSKFGKFCLRKKFIRFTLCKILGSKRPNEKAWPTGKFPGVSKTDQERVENMPFILNDKSEFIVTEKCDGSSATYILEKKPYGKYEFYVCSRNVRMLNEKQECFYGSHNYYWEVAKEYEIEEKMRRWLQSNPSATFIAWQGEICAPKIQGNPHKLSCTHFYCFHWTDSINGRLDIRVADKLWRSFGMEVVPIHSPIVLPDSFDEFKASADGYYSSCVCEGQGDCKREGFVYYKANDPTFSFKNVSRDYLLSRKE